MAAGSQEENNWSMKSTSSLGLERQSSREDITCGRRTRYVLRTRDSEAHPTRVNGLIHFFGRSSAALGDAELLERFRPPCPRDCKGFYVEFQDLTQLSGH